MIRSIHSIIALLAAVCMMGAAVQAEESLGRGLVALQRDDGSVFLSWRMLDEDADGQAFTLRRLDGPDDTDAETISLRNNGAVLNAVDRDVEADADYIYLLSSADSPSRVIDRVEIKTGSEYRPYLSIPLQGDYDFQKIGVGDLNGDGELEYLIKQPDFNTDPYQRPGYWKPSTTTYKIEAYSLDGSMLWRHDMGWSIEAGIWYSPWLVYDIDGDGKAEVYCKAGVGDPRDEKGLVKDGPEYLLKLDGETGEPALSVDWISREGYRDYNLSCRNFLAVAYLDGEKPSLIMQRGTYRLIRTHALDKNLRPIWQWEAKEGMNDYRGSGSHGLISADVDNDGRDELVLGSSVLDDDGTPLWSLGMGHPDLNYVADIDPANPGLEIYYGFETRQDTDGICVVDAKSGTKLWAHKEPTRHIHSQGMAGDVLAEYPGMETYSGERDFPQRWLYSAQGELIDVVEGGTLSPRPAWWDSDPQKEVVMNGAIRDWGGEAIQKLEGKLIAVMDCIGDHREELITALDGELRIYSTTIESDEMRPCLLLDRQYRLGVAAQTMGYYYPAQLGLPTE